MLWLQEAKQRSGASSDILLYICGRRAAGLKDVAKNACAIAIVDHVDLLQPLLYGKKLGAGAGCHAVSRAA
jgi:hypothetical protein